MQMIHLTTAALVFLAAGILTSVTILSGYQILFSIAIIYYFYNSFKNHDLKLPKSAYWLMAFTLVAFLSLVINFDIIPRPSKNFGRLKYFLFGFGGIYVMQFWLKEASLKVKKIVSSTFLLSIIIAGSVSIYQVYIKGDYRADGLTNIMRYGYGSAMILAMLLSALLQRKKIENWFDARIGLLAFVFGIVGLYLTLTRGGVLAFFCSIPFIIYFYRTKWGLIIGSFTFIALSCMIAFYFLGNRKDLGPDAMALRFIATKNIHSDIMRRSQWQSAIIATTEKPFLGWGLSNFHTQVKRIKEAHDLEVKNYNDAHAHNLFLEIAAGTGLIGLFFFLGWLISWAWEIFKTGTVIRALVIPFGVAFIVGSQFEVTFDANNASMIFGLYALSQAARPEEENAHV